MCSRVSIDCDIVNKLMDGLNRAAHQWNIESYGVIKINKTTRTFEIRIITTDRPYGRVLLLGGTRIKILSSTHGVAPTRRTCFDRIWK